MPEFEMPLPTGIRLKHGNWYQDKWITPEFDVEFQTGSQAAKLVLSLWNPDFSTSFANNSLLVNIAGQMRKTDGIKLGQNLTIDVELDASLQAGDVLSLRIQNRLQPSTVDQRERAMILSSMTWVGPEIETVKTPERRVKKSLLGLRLRSR